MDLDSEFLFQFGEYRLAPRRSAMLRPLNVSRAFFSFSSTSWFTTPLSSHPPPVESPPTALETSFMARFLR